MICGVVDVDLRAYMALACDLARQAAAAGEVPVGRVVFGCPDSRFGAMGSVFNPAWHSLSPHKPEVIGGICEEECRALLQDFFRQKRG